MMEQIMSWLPLIGSFVLTGTLMQSINRTVNGKAGDKGFKGVWYVWKRTMILPVGALFGLAGFYLGSPSNAVFGDQVGGAVLEGLLGAGLAAYFFDLIINTIRARLTHKAAKNGEK